MSNVSLNISDPIEIAGAVREQTDSIEITVTYETYREDWGREVQWELTSDAPVAFELYDDDGNIERVELTTDSGDFRRWLAKVDDKITSACLSDYAETRGGDPDRDD